MQLRDLLLVTKRGVIEIEYFEVFSDMDMVKCSLTHACHSDPCDLPIGMWESYIESISIESDCVIVKTSCCEYDGYYYQDSHDAAIAIIEDKYE